VQGPKRSKERGTAGVLAILTVTLSTSSQNGILSADVLITFGEE